MFHIIEEKATLWLDDDTLAAVSSRLCELGCFPMRTVPFYNSKYQTLR